MGSTGINALLTLKELCKRDQSLSVEGLSSVLCSFLNLPLSKFENILVLIIQQYNCDPIS